MQLWKRTAHVAPLGSHGSDVQLWELAAALRGPVRGLPADELEFDPPSNDGLQALLTEVALLDVSRR